MNTAPQETCECHVRIPGWRLHVAQMVRSEGRDLGNVMDLAAEGAVSELRRKFPTGGIEGNTTLESVRDCLWKLGLDPVTTPPCSELLLTSFLHEPASIRGSLPWEFLGVLTVKSMAPWSVLDREKIDPPVEFRIGSPGEILEAPSGILSCERLPVLADRRGIQASPWTHPSPEDPDDCRNPLFICYLPEPLFRAIQPKSHMGRVVWLTWAYKFVFERTCDYSPKGR